MSSAKKYGAMRTRLKMERKTRIMGLVRTRMSISDILTALLGDYGKTVIYQELGELVDDGHLKIERTYHNRARQTYYSPTGKPFINVVKIEQSHLEKLFCPIPEITGMPRLNIMDVDPYVGGKGLRNGGGRSYGVVDYGGME